MTSPVVLRRRSGPRPIFVAQAPPRVPDPPPLRQQVEQEFREVGAKVFRDDGSPKHCRGERRIFE